ncbi:unnamed protein product [Schistocephalus solidus]|uniref:TRAF-type domain-containing protein n=1 Tax=Schistocephalus solidus TaxID=70667 RepID=A0A183SPG0_SCHSO|nr:unnamed protein product [Schistocephalus solidus]
MLTREKSANQPIRPPRGTVDVQCNSLVSGDCATPVPLRGFLPANYPWKARAGVCLIPSAGSSHAKLPPDAFATSTSLILFPTHRFVKAKRSQGDQSLLDKLLVICPNTEHCDEVLCRCDLESHLTYWCRGSVIPCLNAKTGCQFRAARALHTEHRRECRFQTRSTTANFSGGGGGGIVGPGSAFDVVHQTSPVVRSSTGSGAKSAVRFGPMPCKPPFNPSACNIPYGGISGAAAPTVDSADLCVVIQEIYLDGLVALDGRLRPGDQILEATTLASQSEAILRPSANGFALKSHHKPEYLDREYMDESSLVARGFSHVYYSPSMQRILSDRLVLHATHHQARVLLSSITASRPCTLTVYRERASSETGSLNSGKLSSTATGDNPFEREGKSSISSPPNLKGFMFAAPLSPFTLAL